MSRYPNRKFVIFSSSELGLINFSEVQETSAATVRKSLNGIQTFVKYDGDMPPSVSSLSTKSQEYTYEEILSILEGVDWTDPNPPTGA